MKKRKTIYSFYYLTAIIFILFSCSDNRFDVSVANIEVKIEHINIDELFRDASLAETKERHQTLLKKLDDLYRYEISQNIKQNADSTAYVAIHEFYESDYIKALEREKIPLYEGLESKKPTINEGFKYLRYHFETANVPYHIIYMNKLFSSVHVSDSSISVGLEQYIPPQNNIIKEIPGNQMFQWQKERMGFEYLERDVLMQWIQAHLFKEKDGSLAEHIVQAGKLLYVLNACLPNADERIILRYTEEDHHWAEKNEELTWNYLVKQQLLFSNNDRDKANFLNEGPQTMGLPDESPDRMGQFLGFQMVKGYMSENKELSLQQLLNTDYNSILQTYEID